MRTDDAAALHVRDLSVAYDVRHGRQDVIQGFSLSVLPGEFCVVVGDSGSGKSSLLNFIAGLLRSTAVLTERARPWPFRSAKRGAITGSVALGARDWSTLEPRERSVGLVMQRFSLYPHMSVRNNLFFPLRMKGVARSAWSQLAADSLRQVDLDPSMCLTKSPDELSGGQAQRIAIAKMLLKEPQVVLFDEAFSHLDFVLRHNLRKKLVSKLCRKERRSIVLVTHTVDDAVDADTIVHFMAASNPRVAPSATAIYRGKNGFTAWQQFAKIQNLEIGVIQNAKSASPD